MPERLVRFLLLMAEDPATWEQASAAEREAVMAAHTAFDRAVRERATMVAGEALAAATEARTLRPGHGGGRVVTDGPFVETVEQLGGFYLVDAEDLETVTDLADLLPTTYTIEIRPVLDLTALEPEAGH